MAGSSKILTVSYGAFSCTLEGFDDPIAKMREVAEYYRDLAARDRGFGALPQQPNADALREIAESGLRNRIQLRKPPVDVTPAEEVSDADLARSEAAAAVQKIHAVEPDAPRVRPIASAFADVMPEPVEAAPEAPVEEFHDEIAAEAAAEDRNPVAEPEDIEVTVEAVAPDPEPAAEAPVVAPAPQIVPPQDGDDTTMLSAIRGHTDEDDVVPDPVPVRAEIADVPEAEPEPVTEAPQPKGGLFSRIKGAFGGDKTPRPAEAAPPAASRPMVADPADAPKPQPVPVEGLDPVEAALAQIVAAEQRVDRIERRQASTEAAQSDSVDRILERTNSQLGDDDASRRRSTISQLKAAVAATRAGGDSDEDEEDPEVRFRADLEHVVRPEKPVEPPKPTARRMAPLMLVSDQRIDGGSVPGDAIAARRTTGNLALVADEAEDTDPGEEIFVDTTPFIEYAATQQIGGIEDLTEAAAAFSIYVLGQPHFSRSQLMQFVESASDPGDYSREAFLRAFGTLLRLGQVSKVKRGLFNLAKGSRFEP